MILAEKIKRQNVSRSSSHLALVFAETMQTGQISFSQWYELMTAPLEDALSPEAEDAITRLIYGVRHGLIKVV
ncbi:MAG: hypothetical protein RIE73_36645 [Coleofasciculus sp. C1-SOL-03]|jgi:hypothetical protein|uniref:hypothetical protein n=1 Tax=Coleofasciculus sp. C1-SOL-03 TaxID=3069522 RepID=UPI003303AE28